MNSIHADMLSNGGPVLVLYHLPARFLIISSFFKLAASGLKKVLYNLYYNEANHRRLYEE